MRGAFIPLLVALVAACSDDARVPDLDAPIDARLEARPTDAGPAEGRPPDAPRPVTGVFEHKVPGRTLRLTVLADDVVRLRYLPDADAQPERPWTTTITSWPQGALPFVDEGDRYSLRTSRLVLQVIKADATLVVRDLSGAIVSADLPSSTSGYPRQLRKVLPGDEHVYGLGEKTGPLDKRGLRYEMWNTDPWPDYTPTKDPIYQSVPFLIALRQGSAHGLYLASTFKTIFDVGKTTPGELLLETTGGDLDYYFFYGPEVSRVVEAFTEITGRLALPPLWALGYHQSRWSYSPESELRKVAGELRSRKIGCDGLWLDIDYMDGCRSFTWDKARFPDPKQLLADLAQDGFKVTVIIDPGIKNEPGGTAVFDDGVSGKHFVTLADGKLAVASAWPGDVVFPDFSRPATRGWWGGLVKGLVDVGVSGVWIDMNEPTSMTTPLPLDARFDGEGTPAEHREVHNVYALLMAQATRDGLAAAAPTRRPFVLTRAGFAGIQRHAAVWTGDSTSSWEHLAMAPAMLANLGLSGVAFAGTDVGGYTGGPTAELYARWLQLGAISPFFRTHSQTGSPRQEPWSFGASYEQINRATIDLRYRLLPYLYSLMRAASLRGHPPLRPLLFDFPGDAKTYDVGDELLLGPFLLAAPVVEAGLTVRRLYLPAGGPWFDYWSASVFSGGQVVSVAAPLDRLPLLVRAGAIIPSGPSLRWVGEKAPDALTLDIYPVHGVAPSSFTLYQDDGVTLAYVSGAHQEIQLQLSTAASGATLVVGKAQGSHVSPESKLHLRFHGVIAAPTSVTLDGSALTARASVAEVESLGGWHHDAAQRLATAQIPFPRAGAAVVCQYDATVPLVRQVQVQLSATLPGGTTGVVYFASSLDGWSAAGRPMTPSGGTASLTLKIDEGNALDYKYTRGTWATVEKTSSCAEVANRTLSVTDPGGGQQSIADVVLRWADTCP
jgi:alpha-glucosidase